MDTTSFERSPLRRYLDAGGKVVWPGIPPVLFPRDPKTGSPGGLAALKWGNATKLLGVPHEAAMFDQRGVRATPAGKQWGLPDALAHRLGHRPGQVDHRARPRRIRPRVGVGQRYGGPEGTGFVRVPRG